MLKPYFWIGFFDVLSFLQKYGLRIRSTSFFAKTLVSAEWGG